MSRHLVSALLLGVVLTAASYAIDLGCSCGPAHGFPFAWVHPYVSCSASSRLVVGAEPEVNRFGPVLDLESLGYDIVIWGILVFFVARRYRRRKAHPGCSPNGGPAERFGNSGAGDGPPSIRPSLSAGCTVNSMADCPPISTGAPITAGRVTK